MVDLYGLIQHAGYIGLFLIIFAESGILLGAFLPGDSLLFAAGVLASRNALELPFLLIILFLAAVSGDTLGYLLGRGTGKYILEKERHFLIKREHVLSAQKFYERHGGKAVIFARFIPVVRSIAPMLAGIAHMSYTRFALFNVVGAIVWTSGITLLGYYLGTVIPDVDGILLPIVIGIIVLSFAPGLVHFLLERKKAP